MIPTPTKFQVLPLPRTFLYLLAGQRGDFQILIVDTVHHDETAYFKTNICWPLFIVLKKLPFKTSIEKIAF